MLSQVVFGCPVGLFQGTVKVLSDCLAGVLGGRRSKCPNHDSLLLHTVILQGVFLVRSYRSTFVIILGHRT